MLCRKCEKQIEDNFAFCPHCGTQQNPPLKQGAPKKRGNGQGSVYQAPNKKWVAARVLGYYEDMNGKIKPVRVRKAGFLTKSAAVAALPTLERKANKIDKNTTFQQMYRLWLPTHEVRVGKGTIDCYKAAFRYFEPLYPVRFSAVTIDDLQECLDECPHGKRTRENMKAVAGLMYKYAIPRGYIDRNMAYYLRVSGDPSQERPAFSKEDIRILEQYAGTHTVAACILCHIYLGYRPQEFVSLDCSMYDFENRCFRHGAKTEAGKNRLVTVSPKIQHYIDTFIGGRSVGSVFQVEGKPFSYSTYRDAFHECLKELGIFAPDDKKFTPHCCRHTFATLMKSIDAPDKDKLELIGHTTVDMLHKYTHANVEDLRKITDKL